ncbi:carboxylesterase/lipase family protein [Rathayibacter sp. CAU 1779]
MERRAPDSITQPEASDDSAQHPEVQTSAGRVRGRWRPTTGDTTGGDAISGATTDTRSAAFLGTPFAEAPVGELRFAAPVPKAPWDGVLDAVTFGATAQRGDPGVTLIPEPSIPGDSTLNLNVFTPVPERAEPGAGMPVLVWIHGGGYFAGSPASPWYDGRAFNRDGIVTVSISYRLGFDGFGWIADAPPNRGVRDWMLALEWVQENIAVFGGDPSRVTIAGQSAGGGAVLTLLGMEKAQHLFRSVYALSGALADVRPDRAEEFGRSMAEQAGVEPTRAGWSTLSEERVLEVQKKATELGADALSSVLDDGLQLGPAVDGDLILRPTPDSFRIGVGADKPLVLGTTDDEFTMAVTGAAKTLRWVPRGTLLRRLGVQKAQLKAYVAANADVVAKGKARLAGRVLTDRMFRTAVLRILAARGDAPTWAYRFAWPSGSFGFAEHCLDVPFFFDCLDGPAIQPLAGPTPPQALADTVHGGAVSFVMEGDPGWHRYDEAGRVTRVFDAPTRDVFDAYASVRPPL